MYLLRFFSIMYYRQVSWIVHIILILYKYRSTSTVLSYLYITSNNKFLKARRERLVLYKWFKWVKVSHYPLLCLLYIICCEPRRLWVRNFKSRRQSRGSICMNVYIYKSVVYIVEYYTYVRQKYMVHVGMCMVHIYILI